MNTGALVAMAIIVVVTVSLIAFTFAMMKAAKKADEPVALWLFSGVKTSANNARSDGGCFQASSLMTEAEALAFLGSVIPRAQVIHVDRENSIITYQV
jgi:hypothetical protein